MLSTTTTTSSTGIACIRSKASFSDGEVKHSEPVKFSTQLYRKKVHYAKLFKTVHAVAILWS